MRQELFTIEPQEKETSSSAAIFCIILGIATIVAGVVSGSSAVKAVDYYMGYSNQSGFMLFLTSFFPYGIVGGLMFCLAELFNNVKSIAVSLKNMRVIGDQKLFKPDITIPQENEGTHPSSGSSGKHNLAAGKSVSGTVSPSAKAKIKDKIVELAESGVKWEEVSKAGEMGQEMLKLGLFIREKENAPEGISDEEARKRGYHSCSYDSKGNKSFYKYVKFVPMISREELEKIKQDCAG